MYIISIMIETKTTTETKMEKLTEIKKEHFLVFPWYKAVLSLAPQGEPDTDISFLADILLNLPRKETVEILIHRNKLSQLTTSATKSQAKTYLLKPPTTIKGLFEALRDTENWSN